MLFIFGIRTRRSTVDGGTFHCPNEGGPRPYRRLRARLWFTFFFIPVLPLRRQGEWVRCQSCGATYRPQSLRQLT